VPLGAVSALSWCGEMSLGGILIINNQTHRYTIHRGHAPGQRYRLRIYTGGGHTEVGYTGGATGPVSWKAMSRP